MVLILLSGCSPRHVDIEVCLIGKRLAFHVDDTQRWFINSKARPWSVRVSERPSVRASERRFQPAWETQVPYGLIEDRQHTFQPQRSTILYGDRYIGWEVLVEPRALKQGKHYIVTVWSDGGEGIIDMIDGAPLPKCPSDR